MSKLIHYRTEISPKKSTARDAEAGLEYIPITRAEFEAFLQSDAPGDYRRVRDQSAISEYVYESPLPGDTESLILRIFSSIDTRSETSRACGTDAIRTVLWDRRRGRPIAGRKRTHRIATWRKNLKGKIEDLRAISPRYEPATNSCGECGAPLIVREGPYGEFLGCTRYPACEFTAPLEA